MQSEIRRRDGGRLAYDHWPNEGPALMLVPGSWSTASQYDAVRRYLDDRVNLVIVELPGHGRSGPTVLDGSIESFAQDLLLVSAKLGWKSWYVGGHSIGGMIAIELAGRRPEEIAGAISIEGWTHHQVLRDAFSGRLYETLGMPRKSKGSRNESRGFHVSTSSCGPPLPAFGPTGMANRFCGRPGCQFCSCGGTVNVHGLHGSS